MLRVGTCGWTYKDWIGPFYPQDIRDMRGKWLEYYGEFFRTVEIDSRRFRFLVEDAQGRHTFEDTARCERGRG
jgi:uncharacterized protein YecE (DUF72 family)